MTQHTHSSLKETSMADQNVTQLANKHTDQLGLITKDEKKKKMLFLEIQSVHSEGDQPWDFFGRNDAKTETPVFGHLM